jgi:hypothetical protein
MTTPAYDVPPALGAVVDEGRGSLPYALIHGEALVATAAWAMGESGVTLVDIGTEWAGIQEAGEPFVLHDSLCPMAPPGFIGDCVVRAVASGAVVVGVHPATAAADRGRLEVCSPVVLPAAVVAALDAWPSPDLDALVEALQERFPVERVEAPPEARRVGSEDDVARLAELTGPAT